MTPPDETPGLSVGVIAVGDEILEGRILDVHSQHVSEEMRRWGASVRWHFSLGDSPGELVEALKLFQGKVDWILVTGGLGPTAMTGRGKRSHLPSIWIWSRMGRHGGKSING